MFLPALCIAYTQNITQQVTLTTSTTIEATLFYHCQSPTAGGAVRIDQSNTTLSILRCSFDTCSSTLTGGSISANQAQVKCLDSSFVNCYAKIMAPAFHCYCSYGLIEIQCCSTFNMSTADTSTYFTSAANETRHNINSTISSATKNFPGLHCTNSRGTSSNKYIIVDSTITTSGSTNYLEMMKPASTISFIHTVNSTHSVAWFNCYASQLTISDSYFSITSPAQVLYLQATCVLTFANCHFDIISTRLSSVTTANCIFNTNIPASPITPAGPCAYFEFSSAHFTSHLVSHPIRTIFILLNGVLTVA